MKGAKEIKPIHSDMLPFFTGSSAPEIKPIDWLVEGFLARGAGTILFGQPGVSKTAHAAVLCACLSLGKPFAGIQVKGRYRILYLDADAGWNWSGPLFQAAFRGAGLEGLPESFMYWSPLSEECQLAQGLSTSLESLGVTIESTVRQNKVDILIVDSLGQSMQGDGNSNQDASLALRLGLNGARAAGASILVLDHAAKAAKIPGVSIPTPSGAQQKRAWARVTVAIEQEGEEQSRLTRWSVDKSNAKHFEPFLTSLNFQNNSSGQLETLRLELVGKAGLRNFTKTSPLDETTEKIRSILLHQGGEVARKHFGYGGTIDRALKLLTESEEIEKCGYGSYRLNHHFTTSPTPRDGEVVKFPEITSPQTSPKLHHDKNGGEVDGKPKSQTGRIEKPTKRNLDKDLGVTDERTF
jgi:AAA domain